jgi:tricorn protease
MTAGERAYESLPGHWESPTLISGMWAYGVALFACGGATDNVAFQTHLQVHPQPSRSGGFRISDRLSRFAGITPMATLRASLATCAILLGASLSQAQEVIRLARTPDISPDGKTIAFSYLGNIWVVEAGGGVARRVTRHQAHDINPLFSPDGRSLAFSSNRNGSYDVFVVPVHGGKLQRLTFDAAADHPSDWSPDGKTILFTSSRNPGFPFAQEAYTVPAEGGTERRITVAGGREGVFSPKGDLIAYVRGQGSWFRKGYRGSSNDDIWVSNADGTNNRQLTAFNGQDYSAMWSADGQYVYYVSEVFGTPANIVRQDVAGRGKPVLVTADPAGKPFHKDDGIRRARISRNGESIVYECGADLWVCSTREGSQPHRVRLEVHADSKAKAETIATFTNGATEYALSSDEKHVAFVVRGQLFLLPTTGGNGRAKRLTDHSANDHGIAWAPDGRKIIFISDRGGYEDVYLLEADDPEHPRLVEADKFKVRQLTDTREAEVDVRFSPDGKKVGFVRAGKLWTMNPDGKDQKVVVNDPEVINYEWSPDAKWVVYSRMDGSFASELYISPAGGGEAKNLTRYATSNAGVSWSTSGRKIAFVSERSGPAGGNLPGLFVLSLQKPAAPGAPATDEIDWNNIHRRVEQLVPHLPVREGVISPDGSRVAFVSYGPAADLWVAGALGGSLARLTSGQVRPRQLQWSKRGGEMIYFLDRSGQIRKVGPGGGGLAALFGQPSGAGGLGVIPFEVKMTIHNDELFREMLDQSWRSISDHFYDPKLHGLNWEAVRRKYRPLVAHVALKEDLYALLYLMMGELNAPHLGVSGLSTIPEEPTADLGLLFDEGYRGPGLKISEALPRGPADKRGLNLKPGDYILALDGVEVTDRFNLSKALSGKVEETVVLELAATPAADHTARRRVELQATSRHKTRDLLYERWALNNARRVAALSKGKLGYIHIPSMDADGLDRFVRSLYSDNYDKEAIVLDVRYNGGRGDADGLDRFLRPTYPDNYDKNALVTDVRYNGGDHTHDQILSYLGSKEHTVFIRRHGGMGLVQRSTDRRWTRPLVLLINNGSCGDAEIFANAFRTLGLGRLVGQPTGGLVIGTSAVRLIDGSILSIPQVGVYTTTGVNMEREGVKPDFLVELHPDQIAKGIDPQLDKGVEVLQAEVATWKNK